MSREGRKKIEGKRGEREREEERNAEDVNELFLQMVDKFRSREFTGHFVLIALNFHDGFFGEFSEPTSLFPRRRCGGVKEREGSIDRDARVSVKFD